MKKPASGHPERIAVFGGGGHAKVLCDILERDFRYSVAGFFALVEDPTPRLFEYAYLGEVSALPAAGLKQGLVAIGDNWQRKQTVDQIRRLCPDFVFVTAIHPSAQLAEGVSLGEGTVVMAGVCINPDTTIGSHCILNTRCSVDHDNRVGDFSSLAPGVTTGGKVNIQNFAAVGLGASLIHGITVGEHAVLGAGAVVLKDVPAFSVSWGVPARHQRRREAGERYL